MHGEPKHLRELFDAAVRAQRAAVEALDAYRRALDSENVSWTAYEAARVKPKEQA